jgi:hypothetical protein
MCFDSSPEPPVIIGSASLHTVVCCRLEQLPIWEAGAITLKPFSWKNTRQKGVGFEFARNSSLAAS